MLASHVVDEIVCRDCEAASENSTHLTPLNAESLAHSDQDHALARNATLEELCLHQSSSDESTENVTFAKSVSQELKHKKPAAQIKIEEHSTYEGDISESPPNEQVPTSSDSVDEAAHHTAVNHAPTWSTFNSLTSYPLPVCNIGIAASFYRPFCCRHNMSTASPSEMNGDLYDRAVKLKNYKEKWCIKLGALHITMAALKCLGKYIEGRGIDSAWKTFRYLWVVMVTEALKRT